MNSRKIAISICLLMTILITGCVGGNRIQKSPTDKTPVSRAESRHTFDTLEVSAPEQKMDVDAITGIKAGFVFIGLPGDYGFTYAQNQGRLALMNELGIETMVEENVTEDESCMVAMQNLIDGGCNIIFSCSFGYMDYTVQMAEKNPDVYFFHCSGYETRDNMSAYFGRIYQTRYLTGIVSGLRTQTNQIGYVAAFPIPEVIRGANAFALGVKSVNPEAKIFIKWSNTWYDPGLEKDLALELIKEGCDVIAQHQDTVSPQVAAEEEGVWSIGYNSPMGFFAENAYLTGAIWNWTPYMIEQVKKIADGTWESSNYWGGLEEDVVRLDTLTDNVALGTKEAVDKAVNSMKQGFDIFEGPIYDNEGDLRVQEGFALTDDEKLALDWLVDNIVGRIE